MPEIQQKPRAAQSSARPAAKTYIKPQAKRNTFPFGMAVMLLSLVLVISLVVLIGMVAVLHYRNNQYAAYIALLEEQNAEQSRYLSTLEVIAPVEEPKIPHASMTEKTQQIMGIDSQHAILIDIEKNEIVASKNGNAKIYPASMTKVMTLIVASEHITDLQEHFTFDYTITDPAYKAGASVAGFLAGESVPMIDILYGVALPSGADATTAIAVTVAGSEEGFAALMNQKAAEMGLTDTHFMNASGLHHADHYSTPHEMAIILEYAMEVPMLREILETYQYTTSSTEQHPDGLLLTSTMFSRMYGDEPGNSEVIAGKTGYTPEAGHCLASVAKTPDGREFVLVTAKAVNTYEPVFDAIDIYKNYIPVIE